MSIILLLIIALAIPLILFVLSKMANRKQKERRNQEKMRHEASEKIMREERKLHEEEKERWEDDYWKRQERRER